MRLRRLKLFHAFRLLFSDPVFNTIKGVAAKPKRGLAPAREAYSPDPSSKNISSPPSFTMDFASQPDDPAMRVRGVSILHLPILPRRRCVKLLVAGDLGSLVLGAWCLVPWCLGALVFGDYGAGACRWHWQWKLRRLGSLALTLLMATGSISERMSARSAGWLHFSSEVLWRNQSGRESARWALRGGKKKGRTCGATSVVR